MMPESLGLSVNLSDAGDSGDPEDHLQSVIQGFEHLSVHFVQLEMTLSHL